MDPRDASASNNHSDRHVSSKHHNIMICARYKKNVLSGGQVPKAFAKALKDQLSSCKRFYLFSQVAASLDPAVGLRPPSAP